MQETFDRISKWYDKFKADCWKRWYLFPIAIAIAVLENRIVDSLNKLIDQIPFAQIGSAIGSLHVVNRSIVALAVVIGILLVHSYWETRPTKSAIGLDMEPMPSPKENPVIPAERANANVVDKVHAEHMNHMSGILISVKQLININRAFDGAVSLEDMKLIEDGQEISVGVLHEKDGTFRFKDVNLDPSSTNDLFYNTSRLWWLVQGGETHPHIVHLGRDGNKGRGQIEFPTGTWIATLRIRLTSEGLNEIVLTKKCTFVWDGIKTPYATGLM